MKLILKTVGSDPEFFIRNKRSGKFVPSSVVTVGTKDIPEKTNTPGFLIHRDNLAVEGNIPPARNEEEFVASMKYVKEIIDTLAEIRNCELICEDEAEFQMKYLKTEDASNFGCSSFKKAWLNTNKNFSTPILRSPKRVCGMHIHLGFDIEDSGNYTKDDINKTIAKAFDLFLTLPSDSIKYSEYRRENYGQYGSYRDTSYGLECRSLGGYFARDEYLPWIHKQVVKMFNWLNTDENFVKLYNIRPDEYLKSTLEKISEELNIKEVVECLA